MADQDYLTYTIADQDNKGISIDSATQVSGTTITAGGNVSMAFKKIGENAFPANADFTHLGSFQPVSPGNWFCPYVVSKQDKLDGAVTRPLTQAESDAGSDDSLGCLIQGNTFFMNLVLNGSRSFASVGTVTAGLTIWSRYIYDSTAKTFTIELYSDAARTIPIASVTRPHNATTAKRYHQAIGDYANTSVAWSGVVYATDLGLTPAVSNAIPPHVFQRVR